MDKIEIYHYLKRQNIAYEITEHKAVFNMEEADAVDLPYPEWGAKNLFVRDDKKRNYYLITMKGNKRVDLKAFRRQRGLRALSFAAAEELFDIMKLIPGAVTPLGILNDAEPEFKSSWTWNLSEIKLVFIQMIIQQPFGCRLMI